MKTRNVHFTKPGKYTILFLVIFLCGLIYALFTPVWKSTHDEAQHFYRAYQLSNLTLKGQVKDGVGGGYIPKDIVNFNINELKDKEKKDFKEPEIFINFSNTIIYSPTLYIPQVTGIWVGRMLGLGAPFQFYFARLSNLFASVLLVLTAVRCAGRFDKPLIFLIFMPGFIYQMGSNSADALTFAYCLMYIVYIFKLYFENRKIHPKQFLLLLVLGILVALSKSAYFPLLLLNLLLLKRNGIIKTFILVGLPVIIGLGWILFISDTYVSYNPFVKVDPAAQMGYILNNPLSFIITIARDSIGNFPYNLKVLVGILNIKTHAVFALIYILSFILICLSGTKEIIKAGTRIFAGAVGVIQILFIYLVIYLTWNEVGAGEIAGLQGRYFIPVLFISIFSLYNRHIVVQIPKKLDRYLFYALFGLIFNIPMFIGLLIMYT